MNLVQYLELPEMTQQRLALAIFADDGKGVTQGAISQWVQKGVPAPRVLQLVRVSSGMMTCHELRPDLYPVDIGAVVDSYDRDRPTADARELTDAGSQTPANTAGGDDPTDKAAA